MNTDTIQLGHGGGGHLSRELITSEIVARFESPAAAGLPDSATLPAPTDDILFTTDSFVVQPIEFPGGNIGDLAVHGSINDIAVAGGIPRWLSLGLILEEGLPLDTLRRVLDSIKAAADDGEVSVVTGDTKVVQRGACDGLYINTAAIGEPIPGLQPKAESIRDGDVVLVSGTVADHGMAVLAARDGIEIEHGPQSDTGPVHRLVQAVAEFGEGVRFMRDPTRGGLSAVLNELVEQRPVGIIMAEQDIPLSQGVRSVSEIIGIDPLQVACEGRVVLVCAAGCAKDIIAKWRAMPEGLNATRLGTVLETAGTTPMAGKVVLETSTGGRRLVDVPRGELLPRIC